MFMGYEQRLLLMDRVIWDETTDHVIELDLSSSCLVGTIDSNSSLFQLSHLQRFDLSYNKFSNSYISPKFIKFSSLTHLDLSESYFKGLDTNYIVSGLDNQESNSEFLSDFWKVALMGYGGDYWIIHCIFHYFNWIPKMACKDNCGIGAQNYDEKEVAKAKELQKKK
ncbi:hypothetical protein FXO38_10155 [Capsicum annuum]|uniref:Uncharacterized protein n=1 Tax=Capsicum annuum TaxID=4072 RepID=A0A2G2Y9S4_CAPAN|nr:hypothetical protein FXO38_10155 [Capsicum annuum]KAF3667729.1 hypothetical protein FXO37_09877 [Capsicum annuum]PHT66515.1 hypothetical protein T459_30940 [Capsicum annuum]